MLPLLRLAGRFVLPLLCTWSLLPGAETPPAPVTPDASPEARALLQTLDTISGRYTLTGQHNYPATRDHNSAFAARYLGRTPVIFGSDLGHAKAGDTDSYLARPDIVQEAIRQHQRGAIVALCWHAVPPTTDEPGTFRPLPNADPKRLASVQGRLLDEQFRELLTPGTPLYLHWCAQVDAIAVFLKQLQEAHVPVLWRPYHEMNGSWFWWGGRPGESGTIALYRQLFDRLVHHHHLTNLIWVWSVDRPSKPGMEHARYFPGTGYVDVLALDVYGNDFAQAYYDSLAALSEGKPLVLAEVGNPPTSAILRQQPRWAYYMTWAGMVRNTPRRQYAALFQDPRILNLEDPAYAQATAPYRQACGLPPLPGTAPPADFSGTWVIDEDRSDFGRMGAAMAPARLEVVQQSRQLDLRSTFINEYADDRITDERLPLDGTEAKSEFMGAPKTTTARLAPDSNRLVVDSTVAFNWGPPGSVLTTRDTWQLGDGGRTLSITREINSSRGAQTLTLVYTKS